MRIQEYYSEIVSRGRRNTPTYREARRDLAEAVRSQIACYTAGF